MSLSPFSPITIGSVTLKNRFVRSPVCEGLADPDTGVPKGRLLDLMEGLARGGVGLIIPGYVYVDPAGKSAPSQTGLYSRACAEPWWGTIKTIHGWGSKLVFQLVHAGNASNPALTGTVAKGCSEAAQFPESRALTLPEIDDVAEAFVRSAKLAALVGADGVELHGAHGFLLSQFLSPYANRRTDKYAGTAVESRVRLVNEIASEIRRSVPSGFLVGIKLNGNDYQPGGVTPEIAAEHVTALDLDFYEVSCGLWNAAPVRCIPMPKMFEGLPAEAQERARGFLAQVTPETAYQPRYMFEAAKVIKKRNPSKVVISVGGWRELSDIQAAIAGGDVDLVALARPFIRQPNLIRLWQDGRASGSSCKSCGGCTLLPRTAELGVNCAWT